LGYILLAVAGVLKFYPLATLLVLLTARTRRECYGALTLFALVLLLAWPTVPLGFESAVRFKPHPEGLYAFGAPALFRDFGFQSSAGWLALAAIIGAGCLWLARRLWREGPVGRPDSAWEREFACGAVLIVGNFFLGASYLYKLSFAIWLLPWFWREKQSVAGEHWRRASWWLLVAVLWLEGVMAVVINLIIMPLSLGVAQWVLDATLVVSQLLTWGLVILLVRQLVIYCVDRTRWLLRPASREFLGA
jgi:hypothetical protein